MNVAQTSGPGAVLEPLRHAFDALESTGVSWAVLRGGLTAADSSRDVDVLVGPGELERVGRAVRDAGWIQVPGWTRGTRRSWLGFDPEGPRWPILDVTDQLAFGRSPVRLDGAACLRRSVVHDARRLAPADAWWAACLHAFLDTPAPAAAVLDALRTAAEGTGPGRPPFATGRPTPAPSWDPERVVTAVRAGRWEEAGDAVRALDAPGPAGARRLQEVPQLLARRLGRRFRRSARLAICLDDTARARAVGEDVAAALPRALRPVIMVDGDAHAATGGPADATIRPDAGLSDADLRAVIAAGIWQALGGRRP